MNTTRNGTDSALEQRSDPSLLAAYAAEHGLSGQKMYEALARTIFPSEQQATPERVHALLIVAREYNLNPFTKEIYAFPAKGGGIVPVVSVDGWMKLVNARPECEGVELSVEMEKDGKTPVSATCVIHRRGWKVPVSITEYVHEVRRNTEPWKNQPVRMIRHRAFIQAARIAFGFGGIYEADEAARFAAATTVEHREVLDSRNADPLSLELAQDDNPGGEPGGFGKAGTGEARAQRGASPTPADTDPVDEDDLVRDLFPAEEGGPDYD